MGKQKKEMKCYQKGMCLANTPDGCASIQRDIKKLDKWAGRSTMKFNTGKCQVLPLGRNKLRIQDRPGAAG